MTIRNEDALKAMAQRAAMANDCVAFDPATMEARLGRDGRYHFFRKDGSLVLDHSLGIDDPRPSKLRESVEKINRLNAEFWEKRKG